MNRCILHFPTACIYRLISNIHQITKTMDFTSMILWPHSETENLFETWSASYALSRCPVSLLVFCPLRRRDVSEATLFSGLEYKLSVHRCCRQMRTREQPGRDRVRPHDPDFGLSSTSSGVLFCLFTDSRHLWPRDSSGTRDMTVCEITSPRPGSRNLGC